MSHHSATRGNGTHRPISFKAKVLSGRDTVTASCVPWFLPDDTSNAQERDIFILTPSYPSGRNNRRLFISLLVSVEELQREIKQALQLEHNKLAQRCEGFQGSMLCDKAITSWLTEALPLSLTISRHRCAQNITSAKSFLLHYTAPSLSQCSLIVLVLFHLFPPKACVSFYIIGHGI